jgi:hypothetical protein
MNDLLKLVKLPLREKILFFQAIYFLLLFRCKLLYTPPKSLFRQVANAESALKTQQSLRVPPNRITRIVIQASRIIPYSTCLSKALAASVLFAKNCYAADLHIGVFLNEERQLKAHAWLSHQGKIVLGDLPGLGLYQELPLKSQRNNP